MKHLTAGEYIAAQQEQIDRLQVELQKCRSAMTDVSLAITMPPDQIRTAGKPVFAEVRKRLGPYSRDLLLPLIDAREAYGIAKYGQTLLTDDGRDTPTEVVNEMLDALAYVTKWAMQEPANQNAREYHRQIQVMLADMVDYINMIRVMEKYL
jgi:hypothetical protein